MLRLQTHDVYSLKESYFQEIYLAMIKTKIIRTEGPLYISHTQVNVITGRYVTSCISLPTLIYRPDS